MRKWFSAWVVGATVFGSCRTATMPASIVTIVLLVERAPNPLSPRERHGG